MAGPAARLAALQRHLGAAALETESSIQQNQCKAKGTTDVAFYTTSLVSSRHVIFPAMVLLHTLTSEGTFVP